MLFYARAGRRKVVSQQAQQHIKETLGGAIQDRAERPRERQPSTAKDSKTMPGRMQVVAAQREWTIRELNELKKILNEEVRRNQDKEINDIFQVVYRGIEQGQIRGEKDIHLYFQNWFRMLIEKDPGFAKQLQGEHRNIEEAIGDQSYRAAAKFMKSFSPRGRAQLIERFRKLAIIARGGDPYD